MESRIIKIALAVSLACGLVAAGIVFFLDPARVAIYPVCSFHRITGLDCPGCGGLRAAHQLLHGQVGAALKLNAFLVLSLPLWAWQGGRLAWTAIKGGPAMIRPLWLWLYLAAWLVFGILRNLPVTFLAPPS